MSIPGWDPQRECTTLAPSVSRTRAATHFTPRSTEMHQVGRRKGIQKRGSRKKFKASFAKLLPVEASLKHRHKLATIVVIPGTQRQACHK